MSKLGILHQLTTLFRWYQSYTNQNKKLKRASGGGDSTGWGTVAIVFWVPPRPLPVHLTQLSRGCLGPGGVFCAGAVAEGTGRTSRDILLDGTLPKYSSHGSITVSVCPFQQLKGTERRRSNSWYEIKTKLTIFKKSRGTKQVKCYSYLAEIIISLCFGFVLHKAGCRQSWGPFAWHGQLKFIYPNKFPGFSSPHFATETYMGPNFILGNWCCMD